MKGRRIFGRVLVAGILLLAAGAQAAVMRVCAADWPPFTIASDNPRSTGGSHAVRVRQMLAAQGYEISIHVVAWERCLADLADGYYAAAYSAAYRREREIFGVFPDTPLDKLRYVAVVRRGDGAGWGRSRQLARLPQPVGVPKGWALADTVSSAAGVTLDENSPGMVEMVRKVLAGRMGTALLEARTAENLLQRFDPDRKLEILAEPVAEDRKVYLLLSRRALGNWGAQRLAERLSDGRVGAEPEVR